MNWDTLKDSSIIVGGVAQLLFVVLYGSQKWWVKYVGRAMFIKSVSLMLLLDVEMVNLLWDYPYEKQVDAATNFAVMAAIIWQLFAFLKLLTNAKRRRMARK
jgi:hypothetical protein